MPYVKGEKFREMIRSINIFLSIFDLTIIYDENDDNYVCSWMAISDSKGNVVGALKGPSYDRDLRKPAYYIDASTEAFPRIKSKITSSKKQLLNEEKENLGVHSFYNIDYDVSTNNILANNISGNFVISDPINSADTKEKFVEREIDFDLKVSQKPNEIFSISSKNLKFVVKDEYNEKYEYTGTRIIKMEYNNGSIVLTIRKDGNSTLMYSGVNGECSATATVFDGIEPQIEVYCKEKDIIDNLSEEDQEKYYSQRLMSILEGKSYDRPYSTSRITSNNINIEDDGRGNILQLFNVISSYVPKIDMYKIPNEACTFMDYLGSDDCAPIHVFYSLMSVAFGFLNDEELTSLVGLNVRKLPDTPVTDSKSGMVIFPQDKKSAIKKD